MTLSIYESSKEKLLVSRLEIEAGVTCIAGVRRHVAFFWTDCVIISAGFNANTGVTSQFIIAAVNSGTDISLADFISVRSWNPFNAIHAHSDVVVLAKIINIGFVGAVCYTHSTDTDIACSRTCVCALLSLADEVCIRSRCGNALHTRSICVIADTGIHAFGISGTDVNARLAQTGAAVIAVAGRIACRGSAIAVVTGIDTGVLHCICAFNTGAVRVIINIAADATGFIVS